MQLIPYVVVYLMMKECTDYSTRINPILTHEESNLSTD